MAVENYPSRLKSDLDRRSFPHPPHMQQNLGTFLLSSVNHGWQNGGAVERSDLGLNSALAFPEPQFPYV